MCMHTNTHAPSNQTHVMKTQWMVNVRRRGKLPPRIWKTVNKRGFEFELLNYCVSKCWLHSLSSLLSQLYLLQLFMLIVTSNMGLIPAYIQMLQSNGTRQAFACDLLEIKFVSSQSIKLYFHQSSIVKLELCNMWNWL